MIWILPSRIFFTGQSEDLHALTIRDSPCPVQSGQTQAQVGLATGIGERNYQRFEAGENFPNVENLCALADYFEVSLDYLMGRTDQR